MLFDSAYGVLRVVVAGLAAYAGLLIVLRVSGKRTLAKLNAFDLVVTVALGSTLSSIALSSDVAIVEGVMAFVVLCSAQFAVAWMSTRVDAVRRLVKAEPALLVRDGELLPGALVEQRLSEGEVRQAIRATGSGGLEQVAAVVLETDGSLSVIPREGVGSGDALDDVRGAGRDRSDARG